ncbi:BirA family transcriptional regulator, biotin operon repressor / biotin---[acetyl-CoA-carboxylase] ligase [Nematocida major]|uniref:BirA family transcriptional regulator, biotin operon repressor / biotin---[acetyl-CoA-carboxylase] ligase n=1 Tax=Nematocida major TaxID=1912982 RepID=UPI00200863F6|nr:BirA family transcriptional regulator, biotin operon repressor / biotin---[acetyl-CoA-carboxylase] ligase [Nematocida major]KAH9387008.1 BirA family transcriptional regulator, biotin operon repressor / biotin---[acetyl-CoA-carboxylase] ligase [Nematocida major]
MHIERKKELSSSQEYCIQNYKNMQIPSALLVERQTNGKGRCGTNWISSEGSLTFSVLILQEKGRANTALATSNIVRKALEKHGITGLCVKWPNDICMKAQNTEYKVGGVVVNVVEDVLSAEGIAKSICVIGVGLNVLKSQGQSMPYKSVEELSGIAVNKEELFSCLLQEIERELSADSAGNSGYSWEKFFPYSYVMFEKRPCKILRIEDSLHIEDEGKPVVLPPGGYSYNQRENAVHRKGALP